MPVVERCLQTSCLPASHTLPADAVLAALQTDPHLGLDRATATERLALHGPNRLADRVHLPAWRRLLQQFQNPLIYVLLLAGLVTLTLDHGVDAAVIAGVILVNALIGFLQEGKAERALEAVHSMLAARATVIRGGERHLIDATALVPGDIVLLEGGDKVPADLRLLQARNLRIVEAALTGESVPSDKAIGPVEADAPLAERTGMAYAGTLVAQGQARGVVVATGAQSEIGRIGALVGSVTVLATPLTRRLDQFAHQITIAVLGIGALTFAYGHYVVGMPPIDSFLAVVGLAVAAIPEGLPAVVTIVLAIGTRAMARQRAIVRRLPAVETLGSVTVICTDKTGTLTRNEMTAVRVVLPGRELVVSGAGYAPEGGFYASKQHIDAQNEPDLLTLCRCALLCNDARVEPFDTGWQVIGDPTEGALATLARKAGLDTGESTLAYPRIDEIPFESERRYMATLHHDHGGQHAILLKGAPETVLSLCVTQGGGHPLDTDGWHAAVSRAAGDGERVLGLARCVLPAPQAGLTLADITPRFDLLGFVGLIDPPREEAIAAIAECRQAGITVKMITGDHAATAAAIGRQLGLGEGEPLTGEAIGQLDDAALQAIAPRVGVIARASPEHKLRLVAALQASGQLVAMTGDGVNDAPALKRADIGVAMGGKGTDAAREASDLVLTDDNFATIARAVREGRVVFDNIKKSLLFMLPTNGGEAGVILLAMVAGLALPVTPAQILWVNMVTAVTLALALAFEPGEPGVMRQAPRPAQEPLVTRGLAMRLLFVTLLIVAATFAVFRWELARGGDLALARTAAVNMLVVCELVYLFNVRHFTASTFRVETLTGNVAALWMAGLLVLVQLLFTYSPPMQRLFHSLPLDALSWAVILALAAAVFLAVELEKACWRRAGVERL